MVKTVYLYGFPTVESPEAVTKFLEEYTGEGTVLSVNVLPPKDGASRSSATVQFTTAECAEILLLLAGKKRLWYGESYLKAREWKCDMAPRSKVLEELVTLHFGCKISEEKFTVLWTKSDVSVKFGMELKKNVHLSFSYDFVEYKLELPSDTIFRIELHCPRGQFRKFLLIQLRGAPRIYKKDVNLASDNHWVQEVDFTPSCCIEQSSSLCLELPLRCALPDLGKSFIHYIENEGQFVLTRGNTFSGNSALVPSLAPPLGIDLPYKILFKINSLVQHGCIPSQALDVNFYNLVDPKRIRIEYIECALDKLFNSRECCYEPVRWLLKQYIMYKVCKRIPHSPAISLDEDLGKMHSVDLCPRTGSKFFFFPMATTSSTSSSTTSAQTLTLNSALSLNASQSSNAGNDFSSSSVSHFLSIRLDGTNYPLWLAQISPILKGRKLMGIVDGTNPCPPCFLADSEGNLSDTVNPNYENWIAQEQTVLSWINESLTPSVLATVARSTSAFSTWRSLSRRHASQSQNRVLQLRSDLLRTFRGNLSISDYLYKINSIADNLALAGHPMTDEDLVSIIMNNVGPLYETTVSFAQASDTPITYDFLEALLLSTERRMADQHQGALDLSSQLTALHVSNSGRGRGRGRGRHQTWQPNNISVSV
ncbi:RNA-dependent RNA polymerase 1-like [Rosa sericea]